MTFAATPVSGNIVPFVHAGFYQSLQGLYCNIICLQTIIIAKLSQQTSVLLLSDGPIPHFSFRNLTTIANFLPSITLLCAKRS